MLRAFSSSFPDIQAAWDHAETLKPSHTAPRGAQRGLGSYRLYGPNHAPERRAPQGAVRFGFGATQQTQALWICAEHEERAESFGLHRFLGTISAFYLGRSRVYLPVSILPSEINRDVSSVAVHYFHFASVLFTFRRYV